MTDELSPDAIRAGLADVLAPIRQQLDQVDAAIEEGEAKLKDLRALRTDLRGVLGKIDPSVPMRGRNGGQAKAKKDSNQWKVSQEKLDDLDAFLRGHYDQGDDFYAGGIERHPDWGKLMSGYTLTRGLAALADQGRVRLDHVDKLKSGAKFYRLVG